MHQRNAKQGRRPNRWLLLVLTVALAGGFAAGCGGPRSKIPHYSNVVPVTHRGFVDRIEQGILTACQMRGWQARRVGRGQIRATYIHGRHLLEVTITWDATMHSMQYVRSVGLGYQPERNALHPRGVGWMRNLDRTIRKVLARP